MRVVEQQGHKDFTERVQGKTGLKSFGVGNEGVQRLKRRWHARNGDLHHTGRQAIWWTPDVAFRPAHCRV